MANLRGVGIRPISVSDLESLHIDSVNGKNSRAPHRAASMPVPNYFLGRDLVHMARKTSIARQTTEPGLFYCTGSDGRTGFPARVVLGWSSPFLWGRSR